MSLDFLVGGMPRGGTTVAAKFLSLNEKAFCYAGETHLVPLLHSLFDRTPCRPNRVDDVVGYIRQQLMTAMVEMPRFSVSRGAHPKNLIFNEDSVVFLCDSLAGLLSRNIYGFQLYREALGLLKQAISRVEPRPIQGEKTPSNIFAMAEYASMQSGVRNIAVVREPLGVIRSMKGRVATDDPYAGLFKGEAEANIGMYLEYAHAVRELVVHDTKALIVRHEDMALAPASVIQQMSDYLGIETDERILRFVERGADQEIADRAPFNYRRLQFSPSSAGLSAAELWKVYSLTHDARDALGYSDSVLRDYGFEIPSEWPALPVPEAIVPLYGFHGAEPGTSAVFMRRRGALVVYVGTGKSFDVLLRFRSNSPEFLGMSKFELRINGALRETLEVLPGARAFELAVTLSDADITPMGLHGGYSVLSLCSSIVCCPLAHSDFGQDARDISVQLYDSVVKRKANGFSRFW